MEIRIEEVKGFTPVNTKKIRSAAVKLEEIVNCKRFKYLFMKADFSGELSEFKDWEREKLYDYFMNGSEILDPNADGVANIFIKAYYSIRGVYGYTYSNIKAFYLNTKYMWRSEKSIASTMLHEYGHKKGFSHDFRRTYRRQFSICYQLNLMVEAHYDMAFPEIKPPVQLKKSILTRIKDFFKKLFAF